MPPLFILVPLAAVVLLNLPLGLGLRRWSTALVMLLSAAQAAAVFAHPLWPVESSVLATFLDLRLSAGGLSQVMLLAIGMVVLAAALVGHSTFTDPRRRSQFASLLLICTVGMNGAVLATDLFSLYVFIEVTSVASFVLIAFNRDPRGLEGAFKYIVLSAIATVLMVSAAALLMMLSGGTGFAEVKAALAADQAGTLLARIAVGAFLCGLFIKSGLVPFHGWVLGAYSAAPAAVSVLLAGIGTKVAGVYALVRLAAAVFPASDAINRVLLLVGAVSIVVGAVAALGQQDVKRLLAWSSISQIGYIVLGLGCGTPLGLAGAIFHLFNHAGFKSLLFVNAAALERQTGGTDMARMSGLGPKMPVTGITSIIGILSTAGIPPLSGFWSKLIIIVALWQVHAHVYAFIAVLFSVVTLAYLLLFQRKVFFGPTPDHLAGIREAPRPVVFAAVLLAAAAVAVGLLFPLISDVLLRAVAVL